MSFWQSTSTKSTKHSWGRTEKLVLIGLAILMSGVFFPALSDKWTKIYVSLENENIQKNWRRSTFSKCTKCHRKILKSWRTSNLRGKFVLTCSEPYKINACKCCNFWMHRLKPVSILTLRVNYNLYAFSSNMSKRLSGEFSCLKM